MSICQSPSHWASDCCPDRDDQDQSEDAVKDKHTKSEKGTEGKSNVRFMNAIAIVPNDLLSAGDMCDAVNDDDDELDLATVTEHLDKVYSKVSRKVSPTVLAAVVSLTENDVVIDTGTGVSIFRNNDHIYVICSN